jgi:hypothetical protein
MPALSCKRLLDCSQGDALSLAQTTREHRRGDGVPCETAFPRSQDLVRDIANFLRMMNASR